MHLLYLLLAAIPLHLPVDISRPTSPAFPAYHGETLEIEAELKDRGTAFNVALTSPQLYYQTPGMGNSWWTLPATQTNNLLRATFPASADPGEDRLICFLGSAGENFRAAFILNFRHSPGASPNSLPLPTPTLDFSQVTILNSPYETSADAATAHTNLTSQISAVQSDVQAVSNALVTAEADLSAQIAAATPDDYAAVKAQVSATTSALAAKADANQVATIVNYLEGNDARVIITNYDSQVEMPALSIEQKTGTVWRTIWDEQTRWSAHAADEAEYRATNEVMMAELGSAIESKADRAWGFYDSHTGLYAPDGYTWLSSPNIAIAGGLAYERHVTSAGAVWLLESNGLVTDLGGETNGFFRVSDDSGNALFEIVKGERRTVGALGDHVAVTNGTLYAHYSVISAEHPTIYACTNLLTGTFEAELDNSCPCTVAWSGTSGNWTAAVTPKGSTPTVFAKAEYTTGGDTYIRHAAATSMEYLILGGVKYQLGTATISGSTVLTLTEVP